MALAGFCISHLGVDVTLVSQEGLFQASGNHFLHVPDPTIPDPDLLLSPFTSLVETHPRELAVVSTSTQLRRHHRESFLQKVGLSPDPKMTITHVVAYIANMKDEEIKAEPCILFVEVTPKILCAQLAIVRLEQGERITYSLRYAGSSRPHPLSDFVHQQSTWAQNQEYKLQQCVLFDIPTDLLDHAAIQAALPSSCPVAVFNGADLSKYAAAYAFKNLEMLREPYEEDDMTCETPAAIFFSVNRGQPQVLIQKDEMYSCSEETVLTAPLEQSRIAVEFLIGDHKTYPIEDKFTFAQRQ
ncbi:hypothetical protein CPB83DRAFT_887882 [Crepidotus variabilis]|uniref:Uncharacterized protein n=1 Tax=Crepidotus variabilis TaxID=179855 RepID=A0A9P6E348_9AGAR|nr:hypothetical protein CPB83DRAFT_887882 [Crepidotus variabilis]